MSTLLLNSPGLLTEVDDLKPSDFKFLCLLGDGAYGDVWKAKHKSSGHYYAIKVVSKEKVIHMLEQFQREICIMYMISHPHIIKLFSHFEDQNSFYLVMELAENGNLRDKILQIPSLQENEIKQYFLETLLAIEYLHSYIPPIIHRDIKPENIMFDKDQRVKLCDFGFSNYYDEERKTSCGTLEYLPPEIVKKQSHDTSVDIWSLGILLYEMFVGVTPFSDGTNDQVLNNISNLNFKCPIAIPPLAKDLISLMLERNHFKRYTAKEIKEHRWIKDFVPKPGTLTQNLKRKVIKTEKMTPRLLVVTSDDQVMLTASPKDLSNSIVFSLRKSIISMKNEILSKTWGVKNTKTLVKKSKDLLTSAKNILKELESKVNKQKNAYNKTLSKEKLLTAKLKDIDYDILRIINVCEVGIIRDKVLEYREELSQKQRECEIQSEILKNLRENVKMNTMAIFEKEEELRDLTKTLNELKEGSLKTIKDTEVQIHELTEYAELLKQKIQNSINPVPLVGKDQKTSEEVVSFISNFMDNNSDDLVFSIRRLIMYTEAKSRNIEKMFAGMKLEYSEERQKVFSAVKNKKDNFFRFIKKNQLQSNGIKRLENLKIEKKIMNEIELSRMKENEFSVEVIDIAVARNKLYVIFRQALKKDIQDYEHRIAKIRISRLDYSGTITKYQKRLDKNKIV